MPNGLLLVNLGTPDAPTTAAVRRYLAEFLSDPRVIDINPVLRALLLHLVILRVRPAKSARAYQAVWDIERGSPLLYHSRDLAAAVAAKLGSAWRVELAMRYGSPSIHDALARLGNVDRIVALPLFPQFADSSYETAMVRIRKLAGKAELKPPIDPTALPSGTVAGRPQVPPIVPVAPFYADAGFLDAFAKVAAPALAAAQPDHVLMSFHGLPERHILRCDPTGTHCLRSADCCDLPQLAEQPPTCYRAQCFSTARALAERLAITDYTVCFQSRLGRTPWIKPHTDVLLEALAARGVKRLAVMCPAFVADCLETLEEIGIRARDQFRAAGGDELVLVPSLNATPAWVDAVCGLATRQLVSSGG